MMVMRKPPPPTQIGTSKIGSKPEFGGDEEEGVSGVEFSSEEGGGAEI